MTCCVGRIFALLSVVLPDSQLKQVMGYGSTPLLLTWHSFYIYLMWYDICYDGHAVAPTAITNTYKRVYMFLSLLTSSLCALALAWETTHVLCKDHRSSLALYSSVVGRSPRSPHDALHGCSSSLHCMAFYVFRWRECHVTSTCTDVWLTGGTEFVGLCNSTLKSCSCVPFYVCVPLLIS